MNEVTRVLNRSHSNGSRPSEALLPLIYEELRNLARARMSRELPQHTLQATALVHEAWLRLVGGESQSWANRAQFFVAASEAMRRILIDHARRRRAQRHGGGAEHLPIDEFEIAAAGNEDELLAVNESLESLASHDASKAELVKLKYFVGMTTEEAAEVMGLSVATARRHWEYARAWLYREMERSR